MAAEIVSPGREATEPLDNSPVRPTGPGGRSLVEEADRGVPQLKLDKDTSQTRNNLDSDALLASIYTSPDETSDTTIPQAVASVLQEDEAPAGVMVVGEWQRGRFGNQYGNPSEAFGGKTKVVRKSDYPIHVVSHESEGVSVVSSTRFAVADELPDRGHDRYSRDAALHQVDEHVSRTGEWRRESMPGFQERIFAALVDIEAKIEEEQNKKGSASMGSLAKRRKLIEDYLGAAATDPSLHDHFRVEFDSSDQPQSLTIDGLREVNTEARIVNPDVASQIEKTGRSMTVSLADIKWTEDRKKLINLLLTRQNQALSIEIHG